MSNPADLPSVEDILQAVRLALTSETARGDFHRLAAEQEASVHVGLARLNRVDDAA